MTYDYPLLRTSLEEGVLTATIDNPPINLFTLELYEQMAAFTAEVEEDEAVRVLVVQSAHPDFFIAHFDVEAILQFDTSQPNERSEELNPFHEMCERVRTMPKATIAKVAGRAGGGGAELAASFDMRFGALGKTRINQMEVALGILPGGSGTQRLPRLVGRGRALEIILGCDDLDAETAERWGWLNRALPPAELDGFVDTLARRIARFPQTAVAHAKRSVLATETVHGGLVEEAFLFQELMRTEEAMTNMRRFLEIGGQTAEGELRVGELCDEVGRSTAAEEDE